MARYTRFEPDPRSGASLISNIARNKFKNIVVVPKAVAEKSGEGTLYMRKAAGHTGLHASVESEDILGSTSVETMAVDDLGLDEEVAVIKMDVEGNEAAALKGMRRTLQASPNLKLFVEYNPKTLAAAGSSGEELLSILRATFARLWVIDEGKHKLIPVEDTPTRICNLLCDNDQMTYEEPPRKLDIKQSRRASK